MLDTRGLTRTLSHMLRHSPGNYGVSVDGSGWAELSTVRNALRQHHEPWSQLQVADLIQFVQTSPAGRFEIAGERIRAAYGHSVNVTPGHSACPPECLYHGTAWETWDTVRCEGLWPMNRRFVQLTTLRDYARAVASTKSLLGIVIVVHARSAWESGVPFISGNPHFWMAEQVPPEFLTPLPDAHEQSLLRLWDTSEP